MEEEVREVERARGGSAFEGIGDGGRVSDKKEQVMEIEKVII